MRLSSFKNLVLLLVMPIALLGCGSEAEEEPSRMVIVGPGGTAKEIGFLKEGLKLIEPSAESGQARSGQSIRVVAQPINGFSPREVEFSATARYIGGRTKLLDFAASNAQPFAAHLKIPLDFIGAIEIRAMGSDANSNSSFSNPVKIQVLPPAELTGLEIDGQPLVLFDFQPTNHLRIVGNFADGVDRELDESGLELQYTCEDPSIVSVDAQGKMTGVKFGVTTIKVTYGSHSTSAKVEYTQN